MHSVHREYFACGGLFLGGTLLDALHASRGGADAQFALMSNMQGAGVRRLVTGDHGDWLRRAGGAVVAKGALRVTCWGALAMALTAGVGALSAALLRIILNARRDCARPIPILETAAECDTPLTTVNAEYLRCAPN